MVIYGIQRVHLAIIALEVFRVAKRKQHQIGKHMIGRHIVADPTICHGQILVADVMEQVAAGIAWETILEEWRGNVSSEAISEAVRLARQAFSDHSAQYTECRLPRGIRPIRSQTYFSNFLRPTRISCPRVRTPVSANSRRTVPLTAESEMPKRVDVSLLERPSTIQRKTARSRSVKCTGWAPARSTNSRCTSSIQRPPSGDVPDRGKQPLDRIAL
jgi:uncharacterized protein (DUF433 family)